MLLKTFQVSEFNYSPDTFDQQKVTQQVQVLVTWRYPLVAIAL